MYTYLESRFENLFTRFSVWCIVLQSKYFQLKREVYPYHRLDTRGVRGSDISR